jgi:hypothetical protein
MLDWLQTPLSGAGTHSLAPWAAWHARSMVLAWGVLLPLGALVARFFKVLPKQPWPQELDNRVWWNTHRALQWGGVAVMGIGLAFVSSRAAHPPPPVGALAQTHTWAGWVLCATGALQVLGALARGSKGGPTDAQMRGDHYDMTPWRLAFERLHKSLGWAAVFAGAVVIVMGLVLVDAPRWMLLVLALWWLAFAVAFVLLQKRGRCIDTYQAIWGPGLQHPGNHLQPTGWGVRRPRG